MGKQESWWVKKKKKEFMANVLKRVELDFMKCARRTNDMIYDDVNQMYKTLIEQFYLYKTTSYIRHWEAKPGTCKGTNLLYGNQIHKDNRASHSPKLYIEFSGEEMEGGYLHNTPDEVLEDVMNGIRYPYAPPTIGMHGERLPATGAMLVDLSTLSYQGKFFSFSNGTINEAFDKFGQEWDTISKKAFYSIWDEYVSKWHFA